MKPLLNRKLVTLISILLGLVILVLPELALAEEHQRLDLSNSMIGFAAIGIFLGYQSGVLLEIYWDLVKRISAY